MRHDPRQRGTMLLVVVFIATAVAALAALVSGRTVQETSTQRTLEDETRAHRGAWAQLQMAMNVVNTSAYDGLNRNIALREAMEGRFGGTAAGDEEAAVRDWLRDPAGIVHGFIEGTNVRVYRARDYLSRMSWMRDGVTRDVDPDGFSDAYFVLEALGRSGDVVRGAAALVRENEPFSSFVFFQNRHTLGVSGAPRGKIHSNGSLAFYFPNGSYVDPVTSVGGFEYMVGATPGNTDVRDGNSSAEAIGLREIDFERLRADADLYVGEAGLDAEIRLERDGDVRIRPHTPPRYALVEKTYTRTVQTGTRTETYLDQEQVRTGTREVPYEERVLDHVDRTIEIVLEPRQVGTRPETRTRTETRVVGTRTETRTREEQRLVGTREETRTRSVPVWGTRTRTGTRRVRRFFPYDSGGSSIGGEGSVPGEYRWVDEEYTYEEPYISHYVEETYTVEVPVYETVTIPYDVTVPIRETVEVEYTVQVPIVIEVPVPHVVETPVYRTETRYRTEPVMETRDVERTREVPVYEEVPYTVTEWEYQPPVFLDEVVVDAGENFGGTVFVDGRVTKLQGELNGRLTVVGTENVRITGNIRYVDDDGDHAMENGLDYTKPYERNPDYDGRSVLGVIAQGHILFTSSMSTKAEVDGMLMSTAGRVGLDGIAIDEDGEPVENPFLGMSSEQIKREEAYARAGYPSVRTVKESLRRIGGVVSDNRIMETYIKPRGDGTAFVAAGFKRGSVRYDENLRNNPPPNFALVPRPVVDYFLQLGPED